MPNAFDIAVQNPALQRNAYTHIKVWRAPNASATFTEVTGPTTRIPLIDSISYTYLDPNGRDTDLYYVTFWNQRTGAESDPGPTVQGQVDPALEVISVQELKQNYLFGVNLTDDNANPMPDSLFRWFIQAAVDSLEKYLDIPIRQQTITAERHDFHLEDFAKFQFFQTFLCPIVSVSAVRLQYPSRPGAIYTYPSDWLQVDQASGQVEVVPGAEPVALPFLGGGSLLLTPLFGGVTRYVPHILEIDYVAGFPRGQVPPQIRHMAGMIAAFGPLNLAGDLLGGAGVSSYGISLDGLSQNVSTTSSPAYSGYGARLSVYERELKRSLPLLKQYYRGIKATAA